MQFTSTLLVLLTSVSALKSVEQPSAQLAGRSPQVFFVEDDPTPHTADKMHKINKKMAAKSNPQPAQPVTANNGGSSNQQAYAPASSSFSTSPSQPTSNKLSPVMIAAIVGAAVVLIGAIIAFVVVRKKAAPKQPNEEQQPKESLQYVSHPMVHPSVV